MKIPQSLSNTACGTTASLAAGFLSDVLSSMIPWLLVMGVVIMCDLAFGIRKSLKLGIHVSWSMAFRETMGKMVTYYAFVLMVCTIEAASGHSYAIAQWSCLFVCGIEGVSIIGNMLKPYGITLSLKDVLTLGLSRLTKAATEPAEIINTQDVDMIRQAEQDRWEKRTKHEYGSKKIISPRTIRAIRNIRETPENHQYYANIHENNHSSGTDPARRL